MTEMVWVVTNPSGGHQGRMHTDRDCPRLQGTVHPVLEKEKRAVESHRDPCQWCSGEDYLNPQTGTQMATRLRDTDSDVILP